MHIPSRPPSSDNGLRFIGDWSWCAGSSIYPLEKHTEGVLSKGDNLIRMSPSYREMAVTGTRIGRYIYRIGDISTARCKMKH